MRQSWHLRLCDHPERNPKRTGGRISAGAAQWLFLGFFIAFAVKVPLFPFHTWLPDAHVEAPTAGSVLLAGVLLKMGTYGMLRFNLGLFPNQSRANAWWVMILALIGIVYGALVALVQPNMKKLIAYSSISHLGFCGAAGIFTLHASWAGRGHRLRDAGAWRLRRELLFLCWRASCMNAVTRMRSRN